MMTSKSINSLFSHFNLHLLRFPKRLLMLKRQRDQEALLNDLSVDFLELHHKLMRDKVDLIRFIKFNHLDINRLYDVMLLLDEYSFMVAQQARSVDNYVIKSLNLYHLDRKMVSSDSAKYLVQLVELQHQLYNDACRLKVQYWLDAVSAQVPVLEIEATLKNLDNLINDRLPM